VTEPTQLTPLSDPENVLFELIEELPGLTEAEAYALLAGADTNTFSVPKITVAAAEVHTGAMIALVPSDADLRRLAVHDGEPREQLHVTLIYLGEADDVSANARRLLVDRVRQLAGGWDGSIAAEGFSISVFNPPGTARSDEKQRDTCIVLGLSGGELDSIHSAIETVALDVQQERMYPLPDQHRPWIPHITLAYTDDVSRVQALTDKVGPISFNQIRVAFGGDVHDVPLVS
jgi:2'-5' RNA ligase